jgi:polyisoprenoid-binding protein YceI
MTTMQSEATTAVRNVWTVDAGNTAVEFAAKTFWGLGTVRGRFDRFVGSYEIGPDGAAIELAIDAESLDTGNAMRDKHLRSSDFFHVGEHPQVRFRSTRVRQRPDRTLRIEGRLEAAGKVVPLTFDAEIATVGEGFEIEATTNVDPAELGMSSGLLGMIRPPATLHVAARLNEAAKGTD